MASMGRAGLHSGLVILVVGLGTWVAGAQEIGHASFESPHSKPIGLLPDGSLVYVANTPAGTVDVISPSDGRVIARVPVGVEPVGIAVRPDGREVWVANHVSDSVSVIDSDPASATFHHVIATVQAFDFETRSTRFDEPVGVAFASNAKAYVSLSSENRIAIVDVESRLVIDHLEITAQDPRAIVVRAGRLYVVAFESGNQTELSGCFGVENIDGDQCTFDLQEHVVDNNNVLSLGYDADIVRDPRVPDRDLFVYDTATDGLVDIVSSVGTLLYGVVADSAGRVFIAQTEARNDKNGRAGTLKDELVDLENRAFLNQIGVVDCGETSCSQPSVFELEPLPPLHPASGMALATPFAIRISGDDSTLVLTAAGSNKLFTVDTASGDVLGRVDVGWVPRGIALESTAGGAPLRAWVLNAVADTVTVVDLSSPTNLLVERTITLEDPTFPEVKSGRLAFNNANASSTSTFSCSSCHPDGHTDQLLWVLGGPQCEIEGCTQIPVRSTMPVRGVRDTAPYHWDGVLGDPFGLINGQFPNSFVAPNCNSTETCIRHLIDEGLQSTMCDQNDCPENDTGQPGLLNEEERAALGRYLLSLPLPPARERPFDDRITALARQGFFEFHDNGGRDTCGRCHQFPFWTTTNVGGSGMDAPSFRGLPDRWLILPQGRINMFELLTVTNSSSNEVPWNADVGFEELSMWALTVGTPQNEGSNAASSGFGPFGPWQMFLEGSMGHSGAFARQVTLNVDSTQPAVRFKAETLLAALENAAADGAIVLHGEGVRLNDATPTTVSLAFRNGSYRERAGAGRWSRAQLLSQAVSGELIVTLTGHLGPNVNPDRPQPAIWSAPDPSRDPAIRTQTYPRVPADNPLQIFGRHVRPGARIFIDGRRMPGTVSCAHGGNLPNCTDEALSVRFDMSAEGFHLIGTSNGMHLLQLQTPGGLLSNEFLFYGGPILFRPGTLAR